jgi:hypothetical protein
MIDKVPGTMNPNMRCGAAIADASLPCLKRETVQDFMAMLEDFFASRPEALVKRIDEFALRFEVSKKIYGGSFIGVLLHAAVSTGILEASCYDAWGISWFPTYGDLLDLCQQFLVAEVNLSAKAA